MKKISFFLLFAVIAVGNVFPQKPLCNPSEETPVPYFSPRSAHINIVDDDGNTFTQLYGSFYMHSRLFDKKLPRHHVSVYDKITNKNEWRALNLPLNYRALFAFGAGDKIVSFYYEDSKKEGQKLIKATMPKNGTSNLDCETRLTLKLDRRSDTKDFTAVSPDGTKHAFMFYVLNKKRMVSEMRVFVFDENGEEILYKIISPQVYGGNFSVEDVVVNNDGEVALLLLTGEMSRKELVSTAIQVVICTDAYTESLGLPFEEGIINSMKMCVLKNGNYFIGGYYTSPTGHTTDAFFNCFVDTKSMEISNVQVRALSDDQVAPRELTDMRIFMTYRTICCFLQQLEDGSVMMIGNHFGKYKVATNTDSYNMVHVKNIIYQHFASDGEILATPMLKSHQIIADPMQRDFDVKGLRRNYVDMQLSFSPIVSKNDVYIMYCESRANFDSGKGAATYDGLFKKQEYCTVMAKLTDAGPEKQLVMLEDSKKRMFSGVQYFDGKTVYFTVSGAGTDMHHFVLP